MNATFALSYRTSVKESLSYSGNFSANLALVSSGLISPEQFDPKLAFHVMKSSPPAA